MEFLTIFWSFFIVLCSSKFSEANPPEGLFYPLPLKYFNAEYSANDGDSFGVISDPEQNGVIYIGMLYDSEGNIDKFAIQNDRESQPYLTIEFKFVIFNSTYRTVIEFHEYLEDEFYPVFTCDFETIESAQQFFRISRPNSPFRPVDLPVAAIYTFIQQRPTELTYSGYQPGHLYQDFVDSPDIHFVVFFIEQDGFPLAHFRVSDVFQNEYYYGVVLKADNIETYYIFAFSSLNLANMFVNYVSPFNGSLNTSEIPSDLQNLLN